MYKVMVMSEYRIVIMIIEFEILMGMFLVGFFIFLVVVEMELNLM